jgi:hypothetical protein
VQPAQPTMLVAVGPLVERIDVTVRWHPPIMALPSRPAGPDVGVELGPPWIWDHRGSGTTGAS